MSNHERFLRHLDDSRESVWRVASMLSGLGYSVSVPPMKVATTHSDWKSCADDGDLYIQRRVEVKRLSVEFSSLEDWPFRDFIVCAKHSFDAAEPKPMAFVILSQSMTCAAVVDCSTSGDWQTAERVDRRYENVKQSFYLCPLEKVSFLEVGQ